VHSRDNHVIVINAKIDVLKGVAQLFFLHHSSPMFHFHDRTLSGLLLVSLRFDTAGDYGYVGSKYTSNAHVLRGNHLQAHVAVGELTTQIGIVSRTHHYAAILRNC